MMGHYLSFIVHPQVCQLQNFEVCRYGNNVIYKRNWVSSDVLMGKLRWHLLIIEVTCADRWIKDPFFEMILWMCSYTVYTGKCNHIFRYLNELFRIARRKKIGKCSKDVHHKADVELGKWRHFHRERSKV